MEEPVFGRGSRHCTLQPGQKVPWKAISPQEIQGSGQSLAGEYDKAVYWLEQVSMVNFRLLGGVKSEGVCIKRDSHRVNHKCLKDLKHQATPCKEQKTSTLTLQQMLSLIDATIW